MANPQSLLSRIAPLVPNDSVSKLAHTAPAKRGTLEEEERKPVKKRALGEDAPYVDQEARFVPWLDPGMPLDTDASREERLHDELVQFVEYITPRAQEREARSILVARIEALFKLRWPDARVIVFGSNATGLELSGGDVDLVAAFGPSCKLSDPEKKRRLAAMGDVLRRSGMTSWINRIFGARVPIITFVTTEELGEVSVDISIRNDEDSGPRAIPLVKQFLIDMPALRPLILAVKAFLSLLDLNDASQGTLSSYAITLLCISLLQRNPTRRPPSLLDNPCTEKSLGLLLMDFFRHYGHDFSYATHYISVTDRGTFTKKSKNWELKANNPAVLAVQCILNPGNNITRGCGKISLVVEAFQEAYYGLQNAPLKDTDGDASLLCNIYEISREDDARRHMLDESVGSGAFARSAASCSAEVGTRAVSGGVPLAIRDGVRSRSDNNQNGSRTHLRLGLGPMQRSRVGNGPITAIQNWIGSPQGVQQLPVLRWQDDRNRQRPNQRPPTAQFEFQVQPEHVQHMHMNYAMSQNQGPMQAAPLQQLVANPGIPNGYNNHNNMNYTNNQFLHQHSWSNGRSHNVR